MTAAANAIVLQYTSAIWVFALSPLVLGERAARSDFAWLLLAVAGIGVILALQWRTDLAGLLVALTAGLGYGALTVVLRGLRRVDPMVVVAMNFLGSAALLLPLAAWQGLSLTGGQWLLMIALGVGQMAVPYVLFSWALQRVAARHAALIVLLEALLNPVLTRAIIGEPIPTATLIGGPLILASVAGRIVWSARPMRALGRNDGRSAPS
jgi:drug/metabolite transporter (DMT)-like permease